MAWSKDKPKVKSWNFKIENERSEINLTFYIRILTFMKIGLLSDTHSYMNDAILKHLSLCDEIWHGGDFGNYSVVEQLQSLQKPVRGVYGNIDGQEIRSIFPEENIFTCEEVKVYMKHIGGYPNRYAPGVKEIITKEKPQMFISGHSHILKVMFDEKHQCLHMNPGACGLQGWHKVRTLIRFVIEGKEIKNCEVVELVKR